MSDRAAQHEAWSGGAADAYFERNRHKLDADRSPEKPVQFFSSYIAPRDRVLEIGTANGRVLEQIRRATGCDAYGIDPSTAAIADGQRRYPELRLIVGTADRIDYTDGFFDAVLFGFCLYLVDRSLLMRVVAEADRVLSSEGGRLMITDFDPPAPHRRPFKYQCGLWSYKMQYPALWCASPSYVLAEKMAFSHEGDRLHPDADERVASWVLIKRANDAYPTRE